ncbi:hypothetical protein BU16DRAFT_566809 [Lophium mytilinum]|uniref:Uncharacterized protein n=1 Tax=Lophium mytilinum TaxID=390894 RepID=A0A6A6QCH4_9PEZI|nr:hypothetical protein BU16DRAFT_566809 [Lophium mytilinum]
MCKTIQYQLHDPNDPRSECKEIHLVHSATHWTLIFLCGSNPEWAKGTSDRPDGKLFDASVKISNGDYFPRALIFPRPWEKHSTTPFPDWRITDCPNWKPQDNVPRSPEINDYVIQCCPNCMFGVETGSSVPYLFKVLGTEEYVDWLFAGLNLKNMGAARGAVAALLADAENWEPVQRWQDEVRTGC